MKFPLIFSITYDIILLRMGMIMKIILKKQPQKYLASVDEPTRRKLYRALKSIEELEGDYVCINPQKHLYRFKIAHYRIIFCWTGKEIVIVETINTRTNINYRRYR